MFYFADENEIKNSKPAPDVFLVATNKLGVEPALYMVIEDADTRVDAALAAEVDILAFGYA